VIKGYIKDLMVCIFFVLLLLGVCVTVDYAADDLNQSVREVAESKATLDGKYKVERVEPTISMWAKPSVKCGYPYKWYYRTFIDYCPNCGHYNCLLKNPKGVPENEYTCAICDSDFDGVVGKEKYSWSNVYLRRA